MRGTGGGESRRGERTSPGGGWRGAGRHTVRFGSTSSETSANRGEEPSHSCSSSFSSSFLFHSFLFLLVLFYLLFLSLLPPLLPTPPFSFPVSTSISTPTFVLQHLLLLLHLNPSSFFCSSFHCPPPPPFRCPSTVPPPTTLYSSFHLLPHPLGKLKTTMPGLTLTPAPKKGANMLFLILLLRWHRAISQCTFFCHHYLSKTWQP